ncbi:hypothetical protein AMTR_s00044p00229820 [Amborella trichopoda]|uniref:Uncharacterized protein n=1 Tax=Amborella trichopoda TaxID=13333 RepID=U5D785_AMBTC|nr:hypothetical protein AMTR_s00044p00229820 [Amborella trichopoda]
MVSPSEVSDGRQPNDYFLEVAEELLDSQTGNISCWMGSNGMTKVLRMIDAVMVVRMLEVKGVDQGTTSGGSKLGSAHYY